MKHFTSKQTVMESMYEEQKRLARLDKPTSAKIEKPKSKAVYTVLLVLTWANHYNKISLSLFTKKH